MKENIKTTFPKVITNTKANKLSTFGVGGIIKHLIVAKTNGELINIIKKANANKISYIVISGGSNIVFPDADYNKLVIVIKTKNISISKNNVTAEAGILLDNFIKLVIKNGLSGVETLSGIPGSIGGAVCGNAGAYGASISNCIESVNIFDGKKIKKVLKKDCQFSYRESIFKKRNWTILSVELSLNKKDKNKLLKIRNEIISMRSKKYKKGLSCPGSFFKNVLVKDLDNKQLEKIPKEKIIEGKVPAGYLLEVIGACGEAEGDIIVADFHGNLIINSKHGKSKDVLVLSKRLKQKIKKKFNINLEEEVIILS